MTRIECYVEEYPAGAGMARRLRDRESGDIVEPILPFPAWRRKYARFLKAASSRFAARHFPGLLDRSGAYTAAVYGGIRERAGGRMLVDINMDGGGYGFEAAGVPERETR